LLWLADSTGHGASAALLSTLGKLPFHYGTVDEETPAAVMQMINDDFRGIFAGRSFMTAMCVAIDLNTGRGSVVGAGHPPLLIARTNGGRESIASVTPPLGLTDRPQFVETDVELGSGDALVLYTDGLFGAGGEKRPRLMPPDLAQIVDLSEPTAESVLSKILNIAAPNEAASR